MSLVQYSCSISSVQLFADSRREEGRGTCQSLGTVLLLVLFCSELSLASAGAVGGEASSQGLLIMFLVSILCVMVIYYTFCCVSRVFSPSDL